MKELNIKSKKTSPKISEDELTEITIFDQFGKGKIPVSKRLTNNCVIYTRVSSKKQEAGYSLDTQLKDNMEFARKNEYNVLGYFGGTYESASTDERKEFNRMLQFCKKSKDKVTYIIVHMVDRFSRSGANAIYIKENLKANGIYIMSVRQPVDVTTTSGDFQQNIQMIFSHYDNQVRKEKCVSGIKEALNRGEWCHGVMKGYDAVYEGSKRKLVVNSEGKLIRKAFLWKANEGLSNEECRQKLAKLGLKITFQMMSRIFKNPFYCGLIAHNLLEGKLIEGVHEKIISKEIFLKVNEVQKQNSHGFKWIPEQECVPMKVFLRCEHCNGSMTGYIVKAKNKWYYKCRTKGCCNNKSADSLHKTFDEVLSYFTIKEEFAPLIREQMKLTISGLTKEAEENKKKIKATYQDIEHKLERLEERYVTEELKQDLYVKYVEKYKQEKVEILKELQKLESKCSNHEEVIDIALENAVNFNKMWASGGWKRKLRMQYLLFPKGLNYNKRNDTVRTEKINQAFLWMACQQQKLSQIKSGIPILNIKYSALVDPERFELSSKQGIHKLSTSLDGI